MNGPTSRRGFRWPEGLTIVGLLSLWTTGALAGDGGLDMPHVVSGVVESLVYTVLGILLLVISYKVFAVVLPFDLNKELAEDDNPAVGVFMAGIFIAVGLIIAASIAG